MYTRDPKLEPYLVVLTKSSLESTEVREFFGVMPRSATRFIGESGGVYRGRQVLNGSLA